MRVLLVCGFVCVLMFALAACDKIEETDLENDVIEDVFATGEELPEKRGLPKRRAGKGACDYGFWC